MSTSSVPTMLEKAKAGITQYLDDARDAGRIDQGLYAAATAQTYPNLEKWLTDPEIDRISPQLKAGVLDTIEAGDWEKLVNAFRQNVRFGTGGIRGMMAFDKPSIQLIRPRCQVNNRVPALDVEHNWDITELEIPVHHDHLGFIIVEHRSQVGRYHGTACSPSRTIHRDHLSWSNEPPWQLCLNNSLCIRSCLNRILICPFNS